ncbi:acyl-CoA N-acyltransferase [Mycena latifolia]|nr:acyl-CoA N-acyltransferase [Mycena latifolia]
MDSKTPPSSVVVPRPSGGDIIIREFQPKDTAQVYALLVDGFVHGQESPPSTALRRNLTSPLAFGTYAVFSFGLAGLCRAELAFQLGGAALCVFAAALFFYVRRSITNAFLDYCAVARKTDMADIPAHYQSPGGFWVAAIESPDRKTSEVVGYLALDYRYNADPTCGELRRMIVSSQHRRRRIGSLLMSAVFAHARRFSPPLETLELTTSEFQPGARKLYENHGFAVVSSHVARWAPLLKFRILRLRRKVVE